MTFGAVAILLAPKLPQKLNQVAPAADEAQQYGSDVALPGADRQARDVAGMQCPLREMSMQTHRFLLVVKKRFLSPVSS